MTHIIIIGLDHFLQNLDSVCSTPAGKESEKTQKDSLTELLERMTREKAVELVAEEAKLERECLGSIVARWHGCRHINITMPQPVRTALNIPENYQHNPKTEALAHRHFEQYMFEQVEQLCQSVKIILVMCGRIHLDAMARLFSGAAHSVETFDVRNAEWFRGLPMETANGEVIGHFG